MRARAYSEFTQHYPKPAWVAHEVPSSVGAPSSAGATSVASGDLDGDGDLDVLGVPFSTGNALWWENTSGDGTTWTIIMTSPQGMSCVMAVGEAWQSRANVSTDPEA